MNYNILAYFHCLRCGYQNEIRPSNSNRTTPSLLFYIAVAVWISIQIKREQIAIQSSFRTTRAPRYPY